MKYKEHKDCKIEKTKDGYILIDKYNNNNTQSFFKLTEEGYEEAYKKLKRKDMKMKDEELDIMLDQAINQIYYVFLKKIDDYEHFYDFLKIVQTRLICKDLDADKTVAIVQKIIKKQNLEGDKK